MKKFDIEKTNVKIIPFRDSSELEIQIGYLKANEQNFFRYTRPLNMINSKYVVTLHYCEDKQHTPYVYQLNYSRENNGFEVKAMNQDAQNIEQIKGSQMHQELMSALDCIIKQDIQS
ncbi:hypothetical protein MRY82_09395 [bacterium]|nr:hypothetical protein [bacterium]